MNMLLIMAGHAASFFRNFAMEAQAKYLIGSSHQKFFTCNVSGT